MMADLQSSGILWDFRMLLYRIVRAGAIELEISFNTLEWIPSGPGDLVVLVTRLFSFFRTVSSVICILCNGEVFSSFVGSLGISPSGSSTKYHDRSELMC